MTSLLYLNGLVATIQPRLPAGPRLGVIGGSQFYDSRSRSFCLAIGNSLAGMAPVVMITGGVGGVGDTVCDGYNRGCQANRRRADIFHILPEGIRNSGRFPVLHTGRTMKQRREVLGRLADLYLAVEGGTGTNHEIRVARSQGAKVVAVAALGGAAQWAYRGLKCPTGVHPLDWDRLGNAVLSVDTLVKSASRILAALLSPTAHR
jgi:uncharacterized protein (TIGR00725 family)